ncbi:probable membrane-associated kinase regulator 1 isoform X1 [Papaver somniferum]|uniref:probable membrane-associated kinase regulator 1 isoform X1 n=1 Tax=Papaver somniferum TaxID=3469 RepID=UPI000E6FB0FA|nr:probable membrane-associated kinase regulator 1 isoform X1 [Papaver somniferum]
MGKSSSRRRLLSKTLPSSPSHSFSSSSSSSDFEFTISLSAHKGSSSSNLLCPADELFYKGQLLPLHLSPRLSMVRTLLLSPTRTSTDTDTTSRDSTGSTNDSHSSFGCELLGNDGCDSSRPSSVSAELEDEFKRLSSHREQDHEVHSAHSHQEHQVKKPKYFSLSRFSSVFRKDQTKLNRQVQQQVVVAAAQHHSSPSESASSVKKVSSSSSSSAKDVIRKYLKKVKPLYERLSSQKQQQEQKMDSVIKSTTSRVISLSLKSTGCSLTESSIKSSRDMAGSLCSSSSVISSNKESGNGRFSISFSGNLRYPRKRSNNLSCPSSIRSSPNHSGVLCRNKVMSCGNSNNNVMIRSGFNSEASSMNELQNAIQGAIAHCKNSMAQAQATKSEATVATEQTCLLTVS